MTQCTCAFHPELTNWHLPSCPLADSERVASPPALMASGAERAAGDMYGPVARMVVREFLRYNATEGREALVETIAKTLWFMTPDDPDASLALEFERAEAVVTALVGPDPTEGTVER